MSIMDGMTEGMILTYPSRTRVNVLNPDPTTIHIGDIAHHLAHVCRFAGAVNTFYSVAEHSVRVQRYCATRGAPPIVQLAALLHDASEAYLHDISSPLKHSPELGGYRDVENHMALIIEARFDLRTYLRAFDRRVIKQADLALLEIEHTQLRESLLPTLTDWGWLPVVARGRFLREAEGLLDRTGRGALALPDPKALLGPAISPTAWSDR